MAWKRRAVTTLLRHHRQLRPFLPRGYHAYPSAGGWIYLDLRESPMMLARALRAYERPKVRALRRLLPPTGTFVDVGGNKGDFALIAARHQGDRGRIVCVEPFPDNCASIERSVRRNSYRSIDVVPVALADADGDATLFVGQKSGWHSLHPQAANRSLGAMTVPTRTLDALLADRGLTEVDVIKVDVEGGEEGVLRGAEATLRAHRPMALLLDLHPPLVDPVALCAWLSELGFEMRDPDNPDRPWVVTSQTRDVVAVAAG